MVCTYSVVESTDASVLRTSEMCCARLFSSTWLSGQTRSISSCLETTRPAFSTRNRSVSKALPPRATGQWLLRTSNSSGNPNLTFTFGGQPGDQPVAGDWDGDGRTDLGVFRDGTFILAVLKTGAACFRCFTVTTIEELDPISFGQAGDRPIAGDWNGER